MLKRQASGQPFRVIICDDHRLVAEALARFLAPEFETVAISTSADGLLALLRSQTADCLLLDLEMPGKNGLAAIPQIRRLRPELKILVVTMLLDREVADSALAAGADGFVPKDAGTEDLRTGIAEVVAGRRYVSPKVPRATHRVGLDAAYRGLHRLTPRQQEIVLMIGDGKCASEISHELSVSPSTITFHRHNIMRVLGMTTEADLLKYAVLVRAKSISASPAQ